MFKTILVAYDGSDHAIKALQTAAKLASTFDADLHVSHTPQVDTPTVVVGPFISAVETPPTQEQIAEAGKHVIGQAESIAREAGRPIKQSHLGRGTPAQHTLSDAENINADIIVMGRRGLGALKSFALGSVSQAVTHGSKCAVLTVS